MSPSCIGLQTANALVLQTPPSSRLRRPMVCTKEAVQDSIHRWLHGADLDNCWELLGDDASKVFTVHFAGAVGLAAKTVGQALAPRSPRNGGRGSQCRAPPATGHSSPSAPTRTFCKSDVKYMRHVSSNAMRAKFPYAQILLGPRARADLRGMGPAHQTHVAGRPPTDGFRIQ